MAVRPAGGQYAVDTETGDGLVVFRVITDRADEVL